MASTTASTEGIDALIALASRLEQRNAVLEQQNATLEERTHMLSSMAERLPAAEEEARNARADKASLEQEMRLGVARKAAKRINTLISVVPNTIMVVSNVAFFVMFVGNFFMLLPIGRVFVSWYILPVFMALFTISLRPVNTKFVRTFVLAMRPGTVAQNFGPMVVLLLVFTLVESLRPYPIAVMASMTCIQANFMVFNLIAPSYFFRGLGGEAAKMTNRQKFKLTWAFMVEKLGSEKKARMALLTSLGLFYPIWEGTALATKCAWPYSTRHMITQIIKMMVVTCSTSALSQMAVPIYYLYSGSAADFMPPPRAGNASNWTALELDEYMAAARLDVIWHAAFAPILVAVIFAAFLTRGRIHAKLIQLASQGDAGRAAGVAAMIGKLEPQAVLGMARRTFTGLPFDVLVEADFSSNADSGLNAKARRCRLGEVDAFLSHSWHDNAAAKWRVLSTWASTFGQSQGRMPIVWLDKACLNQLDIESQLACLPVYLSGCQSLVVLAGETFQTRIWCIIEIFTFLRMGGTPDRVRVLPLLLHQQHQSSSPSAGEHDVESAPVEAEGGDDDDAGAMEAIFERFRTFDVSATKATKEEERQHLLGVIEVGFGDLEVFNSLVHGLFDSLRQEHEASQMLQQQASAPGYHRGGGSKRAMITGGASGGKAGGMMGAVVPKAPPKVMPSRSVEAPPKVMA